MVIFHSYASLPEGKMDDLGYPPFMEPPSHGSHFWVAPKNRYDFPNIQRFWGTAMTFETTNILSVERYWIIAGWWF